MLHHLTRLLLISSNMLSDAETHQLYRVQTIFGSGLILAFFLFSRRSGFQSCHVALGGLVTQTALTLCHKHMNQTSGDKQAHGNAVTVKKNKAKHDNKSDASWHMVVLWNVVRLHEASSQTGLCPSPPPLPPNLSWRGHADQIIVWPDLHEGTEMPADILIPYWIQKLLLYTEGFRKSGLWLFYWNCHLLTSWREITAYFCWSIDVWQWKIICERNIFSPNQRACNDARFPREKLPLPPSQAGFGWNLLFNAFSYQMKNKDPFALQTV